MEQRWNDIHTRGDRYHCLVDFLKNGQDLDAVEWGFGDPARCEALDRFFGRYQAIDLCATLLVEKLADGRAPFAYRDANLNDDLPFSDQRFDVSIAMMVIEHLFDPFHSFKELARTTKKGGYVFVNLPLLSSIKNRFDVLCGRLPMTSSKDWWQYRQWDGGHLHYFTIATVHRLAIENGLTPLGLYAVGRALWLKTLAPSLFCHEGRFVFQRV